jgi:conjugative transfer signal peptidase TraF
MRRLRTVLLITLAAVAVVFLVLQLVGIRLNASVSSPVGLYIQDPNGPYIGFCPTDHYLSASRHYRRAAFAGASNGCPDGAEQLLKPVAAREGDTVVLDSAGVIVNGRRIPRSAALDDDSEGRPMTRWPVGTYAVAPDQIWVISSYNAKSYDSRYFGPVPVASVRARYRPLLVVSE